MNAVDTLGGAIPAETSATAPRFVPAAGHDAVGVLLSGPENEKSPSRVIPKERGALGRSPSE